MAIRGRKPTATVLRLIAGNPGRRPLPRGAPEPQGKPVRPVWLEGRGAELWDEVLAFVSWLTVADSYKLAAWCDRQAEFEKPRRRRAWAAADRREHRTAGSELGLDISARTRMDCTPQPDDPKPGPTGKYF